MQGWNTQKPPAPSQDTQEYLKVTRQQDSREPTTRDTGVVTCPSRCGRTPRPASRRKKAPHWSSRSPKDNHQSQTRGVTRQNCGEPLHTTAKGEVRNTGKPHSVSSVGNGYAHPQDSDLQSILRDG